MLTKLFNFEIISHAVSFIFIILATFLLVKFIKKIVKRNEKLYKSQNTQVKFLTHSIYAIVYILGFGLAFYSIPSLRVLATSIFAGTGVIALIIGFASQHAFSNLVGGVFIAIFKPFKIGDRISLVGKNFIGIIEDITLRHTIIRTFENKRIVVPNSVISSEIIENANIVEDKTCKLLDFSISYDSDITRAIQIIKEEIQHHNDFFDNRTQEQINQNIDPIDVKLIGFGDSSLILRAWVWAKDPATAFKMGCELNQKIKEKFDNEGIEIPFPYRTIVFKDKPKQLN